MNYDPKQSRLEAIASLALTAEHAGTIEGWRDYLSNEMKTAGLTNAEVKSEMLRQSAGGGTKEKQHDQLRPTVSQIPPSRLP